MMRYMILIIAFMFSSDIYANNNALLKKQLDICLKDSDTLAKSYADTKKSEVISKLEKKSYIVGGASGASCVVLSALVGFSDLGGLAALCTGIGAILAGSSYLSDVERTNKIADEVFKEAYKEKSTALRYDCINKFTENMN